MTASRPRTVTSLPWITRLLGAICLLGLLLGTAGYFLGVRYQYPDLTPPPASKFQVARQNTVIKIHQIETLATQLELSSLSTDSATWRTLLGQIWIPWPQGAPSGYQNPTLNLTPPDLPATQQPQGLLTLLSEIQTDLDQLITLAPDPKLNRTFLTALKAKVYYHATQLSTHYQLPNPTPDLELAKLTDLLTQTSLVPALDKAIQLREHLLTSTADTAYQNLKTELATLTVLQADAIAVLPIVEREILTPYYPSNTDTSASTADILTNDPLPLLIPALLQEISTQIEKYSATDLNQVALLIAKLAVFTDLQTQAVLGWK